MVEILMGEHLIVHHTKPINYLRLQVVNGICNARLTFSVGDTIQLVYN